MTARLLSVEHSPAFLPEEGALRRLPRHPKLPRPPEFMERFEGLALAYDCFRHWDGERILLVGPPPLNLRQHPLSVLEGDSRRPLALATHASESVAITAISGANRACRYVLCVCNGHELPLDVQPNLSATLAGAKILFTMSQNNDLGWIAEWARYHVRTQGADSVIVFDNGSTRYGSGEIEAVLLAIPGLRFAAVLSWPYRYGARDPRVLNNPFYSLFLQVGAMSVVLRRFGARAEGILNCDIDELVATPPGTTIFDHLRASRWGLVVMRGRYVEPVPLPGAPDEGRTHRHFGYLDPDARRRFSPQKKWALDPRRLWVSSLRVHPYMHWIRGRPPFGKTEPSDVFYRHFRAIHTGWKDNRAEAGGRDPGALVPDPGFPGALFS